MWTQIEPCEAAQVKEKKYHLAPTIYLPVPEARRDQNGLFRVWFCSHFDFGLFCLRTVDNKFHSNPRNKFYHNKFHENVSQLPYKKKFKSRQ